MTPNAPFALRPAPFGGTTGRPAARAGTFVPVTRVRLWELPSHLLCSIVGTCMSTSALRRIVAKAADCNDPRDLREYSDVDIHTEGVAMAGERGAGSRALDKALDQQHATWVRRLGRSADLDALNAAWDDALKTGDIPGAYWAVMSHPNTDSALTKRAFGDVHMLSHLVGSSNRADLRKLKALEEERDKLVDRGERQQVRLRDALAERDLARQRLEALLVARSAIDAIDVDDERAALRSLVDQQRRRLELQDRRQQETERKLATARDLVDSTRRLLATSEARGDALADEIEAMDAMDAFDGDVEASLAGVALLYVGGHAHAVDAIRRVVERRGGAFLHHDGGLEERVGQLAGLVSRSTVVAFPVDFVSHEAALGVKRLCRRLDRPFLALRSAGRASLVAALPRVVAASRERATAEAA